MVFDIRIRLLTPMLGEVPDPTAQPPVHRFRRGPESGLVLGGHFSLPRLLVEASRDTASIPVQEHNLRMPCDIVPPTIHLEYRSAGIAKGRQRKVWHEWIRKGTVISWRMTGIFREDEVPVTDAELFRCLDHVGRCYGWGSWGTHQDWGRFRAVSVNSYTGGTPSGGPANNDERSDAARVDVGGPASGPAAEDEGVQALADLHGEEPG